MQSLKLHISSRSSSKDNFRRLKCSMEKAAIVKTRSTSCLTAGSQSSLMWARSCLRLRVPSLQTWSRRSEASRLSTSLLSTSSTLELKHTNRNNSNCQSRTQRAYKSKARNQPVQNFRWIPSLTTLKVDKNGPLARWGSWISVKWTKMFLRNRRAKSRQRSTNLEKLIITSVLWETRTLRVQTNLYLTTRWPA